MITKTNATIWLLRRKLHFLLRMRAWNKIGNAMILIGVLGYFHDLGALMSGDAPPHGLSPDQLTYLFLGSMLLLILGILIRSRNLWFRLGKLIKA